MNSRQVSAPLLVDHFDLRGSTPIVLRLGTSFSIPQFFHADHRWPVRRDNFALAVALTSTSGRVEPGLAAIVPQTVISVSAMTMPWSTGS